MVQGNKAMNKAELLGRWNREKSEELYGIRNWGADYFSISESGDVLVNPYKDSQFSGIRIMDIISGVKERGMDMPVLLRFENLLDSQISFLNNSFGDAMKKLNYRGEYRGVYPIKVNQQQQVVEEVTKFGQRYHHGLEVGSKAELVAALSLMKDKEACLICNGYKDEEFIDLGLYAVKMGFKCFFVIETPSELDIMVPDPRFSELSPISVSASSSLPRQEGIGPSRGETEAFLALTCLRLLPWWTP